MNIETFARQSNGVCTCIKNLEYLLAYSYYCGIVLSVHDGKSVSCANTDIVLSLTQRPKINRFITLRSHSDESSLLHRLTNSRHDKSVHIL